MNSRDLLARMLQAEAGNQGRLGMLAVGSVIDNRRNSPGYGGSGWNDVMLAPGQFSPANSITGYAGGEQGVDLYKTRPSSTAWEVADLILSGQYEDPTGGALNFVNTDISRPSWLKTMRNTTKIGDHLFGSAGTGEGASGRPGGRRPNQDVADDAMRAMGKTPMSQPQAGGLLGDQLGTDMAEYEPERAGGLLGRVFPNMSADRRDQIKMGLAGMSLNPNQALIGGIEARMGERSKDRDEFKAQQKVQAQKNKTIAFIEAQVQAGKLPQELLQMAQADPAVAYKAAVEIMTRQPKAPTPYSDAAKAQSDLRGGFITQEQYQQAVSGDGDMSATVQALDQRAKLGGLQPGSPEYRQFMIDGGAKSGISLEVGPDGSVRFGTGGASGKALTEGQSKDTTYAVRAEGALPTLDKYDEELAQLGEKALDADPTGILRGRFQSPEYQMGKQAGEEFLQAILRKDTGAAITSDEQALYGGTYLPQLGDGSDVIAQKKQARRRALAALKAGMPPSAIVAQEKALQGSGPSAPDDDALFQKYGVSK